MPPSNVMVHETIEKQDSPDDTLVLENAKSSNNFRRDFITTRTSPPKPAAVYDGGYGAAEIRLCIATGGAGQTGLIKDWADKFIQYMVKERQEKPFQVIL
jgi:hypothetical protein